MLSQYVVEWRLTQNNDTQSKQLWTCFGVVCSLHARSSNFSSPKHCFFTWKTCSWTVQNNAQNALKVVILRYKIKNFSPHPPRRLDSRAYGSTSAPRLPVSFFRYFRPCQPLCEIQYRSTDKNDHVVSIWMRSKLWSIDQGHNDNWSFSFVIRFYHVRVITTLDDLYIYRAHMGAVLFLDEPFFLHTNM